MKRGSTWLGFVACLFVLPSLAGGAEPTLAETLAWMDSTYNSHFGEGGAFGHGVREMANNGKPFKRQTQSLKSVGCNMTLTTQDDPNVSTEIATTTVEAFNMRDIDSRSITLTKYDSQHGGLSCEAFQNLTCDMATLQFETRNQLPLMTYQMHSVFPKLKGKDHDSEGTGKSFVAQFLLDEVPYALRFEQAFRHAVSLCGGKPSTF